jgi:eukaryotic translation initiation factor 2C
MLDELKDMMYERLLSYKKHNSSTLPERIIVFRDGVSEVCSLSLPAVLI